MSAMNARNLEAQSLITALADFVVPIVEMHKGHGNIDLSQLADSTYGKNVVIALGEFLASKLKPEIRASKEKTETKPFNALTLSDTIAHRDKDKKKDGHAHNFSGGTASSFDDENLHMPSLLTQAMNKTRHFIFNKMPIRLLTFDSNGSNIRLIERSEIWQNVSKRMIQDYDRSKINPNISGLSSRRSGDVKKEAIKARDDAIENFCKKYYEQYAILSHTWIQEAPGEVIYPDWVKGQIAEDSPGHNKLTKFCRIAATKHNVTFAWMDTVCINKENSAELDESIRSMYNWYRSATVCIIYLAGTPVLDKAHADPWFTRGWTLQEMLSPKLKCFYLMYWDQVPFDVKTVDKNPLTEQISLATSITGNEMNTEPQSISISRRMQWAATRNVTRDEDAAYSLMGIFGVSMSTAYGEGAEHAFLRLVKEILATNSAKLLDIVNWGHDPSIGDTASSLCTSQLIPSRPKQYSHSASTPIRWGSTRVPVTLTQKGLHVSVVLMAGHAISAQWFHEPTKFPSTPQGEFFARAEVHFITYPYTTYFDILPKSSLNASQLKFKLTAMFAVLNHSETADEIIFHDNICFAVALSDHKKLGLPHDGDEVRLDKTASAITFRIQQLPPDKTASAIKSKIQQLPPATYSDIRIKKTELVKHGMYLRTLYM